MSKDEKTKKSELSQEAILSAEFDYIAQATFQANEDRARVTSFYLVSLGSFIAALVSSDFWNAEAPTSSLSHIGFGLLFLLLTFQGVLTLMQLARLRSAWFDSVAAMNQIKDYYKEEFPGIKKAFRWQNKTLPAKYKTSSVGFYLAMQVAILSGITLAAAIGEFLSPYFDLGIILLLGGIIIIVTAIILLRRYKAIVES